MHIYPLVRGCQIFKAVGQTKFLFEEQDPKWAGESSAEGLQQKKTPNLQMLPVPLMR